MNPDKEKDNNESEPVNTEVEAFDLEAATRSFDDFMNSDIGIGGHYHQFGHGRGCRQKWP